MLILIRVPALLWPGRFWAEEGSIYFREAYKDPPIAVIMRSNLGYYSLFNKLSCVVAAHAVPISYAPVVTAVFALFVQLLPIASLLFSRLDSMASAMLKVCACFVILLVQPNQEVWLNTINSQFFLCVAAAVVLMSEPTGRSSHLIRIGSLVLAGLTGVISCLLVPFFIVEYARSRTAHRLHEIMALGSACVVQGAIICLSQDVRESLPYWNILPFALLAKQWFLPFLGIDATQYLCALIRQHQLFLVPWIPALALLPHAVSGLALAVWGRRQALLLFIASLSIASISFLKSVEAQNPIWILDHISALGAGRYYYAPNVLLGLALLMTPRSSPLRGARWSGLFRLSRLAMVALLLFVGAHDFVTSNRHSWFFSGPSWQSEVRNWRDGRSEVLHIWPRPWVMELPRTQTESPNKTAGGDSQ